MVAWLKKWGGVIAGALLALVGAGWLWKRRATVIGQLRDKLAVEQATTEIIRLQAVREEVKKNVGETDTAIEAIETQIHEQKRKIVRAYADGHKVPEDELEDVLASLGY